MRARIVDFNFRKMQISDFKMCFIPNFFDRVRTKNTPLQWNVSIFVEFSTIFWNGQMEVYQLSFTLQAAQMLLINRTPSPQHGDKLRQSILVYF